MKRSTCIGLLIVVIMFQALMGIMVLRTSQRVAALNRRLSSTVPSTLVERKKASSTSGRGRTVEVILENFRTKDPRRVDSSEDECPGDVCTFPPEKESQKKEKASGKERERAGQTPSGGSNGSKGGSESECPGEVCTFPPDPPTKRPAAVSSQDSKKGNKKKKKKIPIPSRVNIEDDEPQEQPRKNTLFEAVDHQQHKKKEHNHHHLDPSNGEEEDPISREIPKKRHGDPSSKKKEIIVGLPQDGFEGPKEGLKRGSNTAVDLEKLLGNQIDWKATSVKVKKEELSADETASLHVKKAPKELTHLKNAALVVLCYNRKDYLEKTLSHILKAKLSGDIKKYISQDGHEHRTQQLAKSEQFSEEFEYLSHPRKLPKVLHQETTDPLYKTKETPSTMYLAAHYKWILDKLFLEKGHTHVIIVEDDMKISKDFIAYFEMLAPLLDLDPSLWCISSWNDNGFKTLDLPETGLYRTSNFPGLGWMMRRQLWEEELSDKFPKDNWDHWMRASTTSKNRDCIAPFLPRNYNIGVEGATSNREFFDRYMATMQFYDRSKVLPLGDLTRLLRWNYDMTIKKMLSGLSSAAREDEEEEAAVDSRSVKVLTNPPQTLQLSPRVFDDQGGKTKLFVVPYLKEQFDGLGNSLRIHPVPRTHYKGLVWLKFNEVDIFLIDRRISPFAELIPDTSGSVDRVGQLTPGGQKKNPHPTLTAVRAKKPGQSCQEVCHKFGGAVPGEEATAPASNDDDDGAAIVMRRGGKSSNQAHWECAADQFDFINDCHVLAQYFDGCPNGCTQGWGDDIPNMETKELGHPPQCLVTEAVPTCMGDHPRTIRLCPCVTKKKAPKKKQLKVTPAERMGQSCDKVCSLLGEDPDKGEMKDWRCDETQFKYINTCDVLKKHFECETCDSNYGADLPNYVAAEHDNNYEKCLLMGSSQNMECAGSHQNTKRLCPCVPK